MQTIGARDNCLARVCDFTSIEGWVNPEESAIRARWCCEQLEDSRILFFESLPFVFPEEDRKFLVSQRLGDSKLHKNISYRPVQDLLRGFSPDDAAAGPRMQDVMRRYSENVTRFLSRLLAPYASQWSLDYASFRPVAEESRNLPLHKRNDLLHIDAFPSRPTQGGRILRCFTNINPSDPRVWQTTDSFPVLARNHAGNAGLEAIAMHRGPGFGGILKALGLKTKTYSPYDRFMLRFHDYLKENSTFQRDCRKIRLEFPPGSTWMCFTDSAPHAVIQGQFAVEQTLVIPVSAMITPEKSPVRILEKMIGRALVPASPSQP
jgi:hypothetical protein